MTASSPTSRRPLTDALVDDTPAGDALADPPQIVLGAMNFGTTVPEPAAFELLDAFVDAGGVWIDTADCHAFWHDPRGVGGASEEVIGRWRRARPESAARVRIATKVRQQPQVPHRWPETAAGLSAAAIDACLAASLDRLEMDGVDLLWAHAEDRSVPLAETVVALGDAVARGRAARLGASNHATWRVERARSLARGHELEPFTALQLRHSYVAPRPGTPVPDAGHLLATDEAFGYAAAEHLTVWVYTPLLNGAYVRADRPLPEVYDHPGTTRRLEALAAVSAALGTTPNQVVLAWLMAAPVPASPIVGVSSVAQLREAMEARAVELGDEHRARLDGAM